MYLALITKLIGTSFWSKDHYEIQTRKNAYNFDKYVAGECLL